MTSLRRRDVPDYLATRRCCQRTGPCKFLISQAARTPTCRYGQVPHAKPHVWPPVGQTGVRPVAWPAGGRPTRKEAPRGSVSARQCDPDGWIGGKERAQSERREISLPPDRASRRLVAGEPCASGLMLGNRQLNSAAAAALAHEPIRLPTERPTRQPGDETADRPTLGTPIRFNPHTKSVRLCESTTAQQTLMVREKPRRTARRERARAASTVRCR